MRRRYVYLLEALGHNSNPKYATVYNKRLGEKMLREAGGSEVYAMSSRSYHDPSCIYGWDVPTFKVCADHSWRVAA